MAKIPYSAQYVLNLLYGSSPTQYSEQQVVNFIYGTNNLSFQTILNRNLGVSDTYYSEQEALWRTLQSELTLTGSPFQYSVQELLNLAYVAGLTLPYIVGTSSSVGLPGGGGGSSIVGANAALSLLGQ